MKALISERGAAALMKRSFCRFSAFKMPMNDSVQALLYGGGTRRHALALGRRGSRCCGVVGDLANEAHAVSCVLGDVADRFAQIGWVWSQG